MCEDREMRAKKGQSVRGESGKCEDRAVRARQEPHAALTHTPSFTSVAIQANITFPLS